MIICELVFVWSFLSLGTRELTQVAAEPEAGLPIAQRSVTSDAGRGGSLLLWPEAA